MSKVLKIFLIALPGVLLTPMPSLPPNSLQGVAVYQEVVESGQAKEQQPDSLSLENIGLISSDYWNDFSATCTLLSSDAPSSIQLYSVADEDIGILSQDAITASKDNLSAEDAGWVESLGQDLLEQITDTEKFAGHLVSGTVGGLIGYGVGKGLGILGGKDDDNGDD